ncbi:sensor histidine kinase [Luteimonas sp. A611]
MLAFAGFTLAVTALFGLYAVVFAYTVEDMFFSGMLQREASEQLQHHAGAGRWATPRESWMRVIEDADRLPAGIGDILQAEPGRTEFAGPDGAHYHLRELDAPGARAWLVAEVSGLLVVRPQRAALLQVLAWSAIAMATLALLLGWWLAQRTTAPLSRLALLMAGTAPDRLPTAFACGFRDDEVGLLARRLEELVARIGAFVAREREFTRDASHELRTPLAVIRSATERLAADPTLSSEARDSLAHIRHSASWLEQTVSALLSLAREEAPPTGDVSTPVLPLLERVVVDQSPLLGDKDIVVDIDVPAGASAALPAPALNILLSNLVGNAFAHTHAGRILIRADAGRLRICNPGARIRDADLLPFIKAEASTGSGLGLSIAMRLCDRYGIDLAIEEVEPGRVAVSLPLRAA